MTTNTYSQAKTRPDASKLLDLRGANRGNLAFSRAVLTLEPQHTPLLPAFQPPIYGATQAIQKALSQPAPLATPPQLHVQIVDKTPGRAEERADLYRQHGHSALAVHDDALSVPPLSKADVLACLTDDASVQVQLFQRGGAHLAVVGLLVAVSASTGGHGFVLGMGAVVPEEDAQCRQAVTLLLERLAALSGGRRVTSQRMRDPLPQAAQMGGVRDALYGRIAGEVNHFLHTGQAKGRIFVAGGSVRTVAYPMSLLPRRGRTREAMHGLAAEVNADSAATGGRATAFLDIDNLNWLYVGLPDPLGSSRGGVRGIELPPPPAPGQWIEMQRREAEARAREIQDWRDREAARQAAIEAERRARSEESLYMSD